jgi:putative transposase
MQRCGRVTNSPHYAVDGLTNGKERNFSGEHFWARGYAISTVGFELEQVRQYIREQDASDGAAGQF